MELGWHPQDVTKKMTLPQLKLMYSRFREKCLDWTEMQASLVWSIYTGKWSRPGKTNVVKDETEALKKFHEMGVVVDG